MKEQLDTLKVLYKYQQKQIEELQTDMQRVYDYNKIIRFLRIVCYVLDVVILGRIIYWLFFATNIHINFS